MDKDTVMDIIECNVETLYKSGYTHEEIATMIDDILLRAKIEVRSNAI